jgi:hypothetical protein
MDYEPIPTQVTLDELAALCARSFNHLSAQLAALQEDIAGLKRLVDGREQRPNDVESLVRDLREPR